MIILNFSRRSKINVKLIYLKKNDVIVDYILKIIQVSEIIPANLFHL